LTRAGEILADELGEIGLTAAELARLLEIVEPIARRQPSHSRL
jgi:plasmid maintenance system antidote protein VapI